MTRGLASRGRSAPVPAVDRAARLLLALGDGQKDVTLTAEQEKNFLPPGDGGSAPGGASAPLVN